MSLPVPICLADWLRAVHALDADAQEQRAIAELLGLCPVPPAQAPTPAAQTPAVVPPASFPSSPRAEEAGAAALPTVGPATQTVLIPDGPDEAARRPPPWAAVVRPLPPPLPAEAAYRPALEPLFVPAWSRGILRAALATRGDGYPDLDRLVDDLAWGRPLTALPTLPWPTLSRGIQLLVDMGESMAPFFRDQAHLEAEVLRVVGRENVEVLRFAGCPSRGAGRGGRHAWTTYRLPRRGAPVLMLTDLGIGRVPFASEPTESAQWQDFAAEVRRAGHPLVALVPYGPARWPAGLAPLMTIVHWDRPTSAVTIYRRVGAGHEVRS
jgi:hypothetical protein